MASNYKIDQYNYRKQDSAPADGIFMTPITGGIPIVISTGQTHGSVGSLGEVSFDNNALYLTGNDQNTFLTSNNYYYHGKIKELSSNQIINIYLVTATKTQGSTSYTIGEVMQFIKQVNIIAGDETKSQWADIECTFTPYDGSFNAILFELNRTATDDYTTAGPRYTLMIHTEISIIKNLLTNPISIGNNSKVLKLGVQSRPNLVMCINGEEIRTSRTGIYEIRNGIVPITFFSIVTGAFNTDVHQKELDLNVEWNTRPHNEIQSACLIDKLSTRVTDSFTMDYMYRQEI